MSKSYEQTLADTLSSGLSEIKDQATAKFSRLEAKISAIEAQMKNATAGEIQTQDAYSLGRTLTENKSFREWISAKGHLGRERRTFQIGSTFGDLEGKSTITRDTLGFPIAGIVPSQRIPDMGGIGMQPLRIRDIMTVRPMGQAGSIEFLKKTARTVGASPQVEGTVKNESAFTLVADSARVRTIAHYIQASRQSLEDVPGFRGVIDTELMYGLKLKEEAEILAGDGNGEHLSGLITEATPYDTGANVEGDTKLDKLRHAKLQVRKALFDADAIVLNPEDWEEIELLKDEQKRYLVGNPTSNGPGRLWSLPVVESDSIDAGTFLVGAFRSGAVLFDRAEATIDISFEHGENFTKNEATILCEERVVLVTIRPTSFVYGSF